MRLYSLKDDDDANRTYTCLDTMLFITKQSMTMMNEMMVESVCIYIWVDLLFDDDDAWRALKRSTTRKAEWLSLFVSVPSLSSHRLSSLSLSLKRIIADLPMSTVSFQSSFITLSPLSVVAQQTNHRRRHNLQLLLLTTCFSSPLDRPSSSSQHYLTSSYRFLSSTSSDVW